MNNTSLILSEQSKASEIQYHVCGNEINVSKKKLTSQPSDATEPEHAVAKG